MNVPTLIQNMKTLPKTNIKKQGIDLEKMKEAARDFQLSEFGRLKELLIEKRNTDRQIDDILDGKV